MCLSFSVDHFNGLVYKLISVVVFTAWRLNRTASDPDSSHKAGHILRGFCPAF
jgi:hypothetical protein